MSENPILIGHRGARGEAPENTLQGFEWAWTNGIRSFEFDLQLSADGELFILHDEDLIRTCGVAGRAADLSLEALRAFDGRKVGPPWPAPCRIPALQEVLDLLLQAPEQVEQVQLEVKTTDTATLKRLCDRLSAALASLPKTLLTKCVVTSFNPLVPGLIQAADVTGLRQGLAVEDKPVLQALLTNSMSGLDLVALNHQMVTGEVVQRLRHMGLEVSCWTVNASQDWQRVCAAGVDSVITDHPLRMQQIQQHQF
ncbi:glycerophosphodiester phosphodiesterase [Allohahella marinimesophila]|uniref:Glycerophosphodiester phosphodiesterase n=1 Tax=Allohahella marinimesophila TaxID=1054972 RepID=A0ABP7Q8W2_9GAMM